MTCPYSEWDGAYVLGALSPSERLEYAGHLSDCDSCSASIQRLVGLPGLLSRVPAGVLEDAAEEGEPTAPVPPSLLPSLVAQVRRDDRRRTWTVRGLVAAAVVAVAVAGGAVVQSRQDEPAETRPPAAQAVPMSPIGDTSMTAEVSLTSVGWGTKIEVTCSYPVSESGYAVSDTSFYAMYVETSSGQEVPVASWSPLPGKTMQVAGATAVKRDEIASVVIRTASGDAVAQLRT